MAACLPALWLMACDCRPVIPSHWNDLGVQCNGNSHFAQDGSEQAVLQSTQEWENFLRFDCLRGETNISVPDVDFSRRVVVVDVSRSPLSDGQCVRQRQVADVRACQGGVEMLFDDVEDPDCTPRPLTGAISINRDDARGAFRSAQGPFSQ